MGDPPPPPPHLLWSEKSLGSETSKAPTQGPEIFRVESLRQSTPPVKKYSDVILSSLEDLVPPFSGICSYRKQKVIGLGNIDGPYPGAWTFQGRFKGTIYAPCNNIVMLSCLVWKIRSPHFQVYGLLWSEKSSGSETSKAPTQGPEIFRTGLRRQSTPPVKI